MIKSNFIWTNKEVRKAKTEAWEKREQERQAELDK